MLQNHEEVLIGSSIATVVEELSPQFGSSGVGQAFVRLAQIRLNVPNTSLRGSTGNVFISPAAQVRSKSVAGVQDRRALTRDLSRSASR